MSTLTNSQELRTAQPARSYDPDFVVSEDYRNSLPDLQNTGKESIRGSNVPILQVGCANFRLPLRYMNSEGDIMILETRVTGTVSLEKDTKGINMSRILRVFQTFSDRIITPELLSEILESYRKELGSRSARLKLRFSYPMKKRSLRSGLEGIQYYDMAYEGITDANGLYSKRIHFDFVYSSACPCSTELSEHARETRNILAVPHSQRSKARVSLEIEADHHLSPEQIRDRCLSAIQTETQVLVKREDEQAFAELNGAHTKFVEDAARLLHEGFDSDPAVADFQIACAHLESLHSHDAVSVITKGIPGGFEGDFMDFEQLLC